MGMLQLSFSPTVISIGLLYSYFLQQHIAYNSSLYFMNPKAPIIGIKQVIKIEKQQQNEGSTFILKLSETDFPQGSVAVILTSTVSKVLGVPSNFLSTSLNSNQLGIFESILQDNSSPSISKNVF
ncbi:hypothetical protein PPERSA_11954 [Pseudocohnilembus persalinus]|uniref:Uncharacterized protein n=1 Tax=Pseudocohnilembus persalinus TaxID=266149 RepID=A0A0V0QK60_PSEPJ|nr:hypothetical protein PPERSA_11954 [Pseudocohnilembus persalinus]|eukprot:KRX02614.1 hypothetical protein PPERSA_11954 [Pseudocohnilembus persalinus]